MSKLRRYSHQQSQPGRPAAQGRCLPGERLSGGYLKIGRSRPIVPQGKRWDDLFQTGPRASDDFMVDREAAAGRAAAAAVMLTYMLDTNICIYVMKNYPPPACWEKFNALAEQLCISSITLGELHYGAEKSRAPRRQFDRH